MASAALSRADVLRVLAGHDAAAVARMAALCGFERQALTVTIDLGKQDVQPKPIAAAEFGVPTIAQAEARAPLQARLFDAWLTETPPQAAKDNAKLTPLSFEELQPDLHATLPPKAPVVRATQLWPALKQSLSKAVAGDLDLTALVDQLACTQQWDPLPLLGEHIWRAPLWVIWDQEERLTPYQSDYQALYRLLRRMRGESELSLYTRHDDGTFKRWHMRGGQALSKLPKPAPGTSVLVLSDLGALASSTWQEQRWLQRLRDWRSAGADVLAWLPSAPGQVHADVARAASVRHLCELGRMRPQRRGWRDPAQREVHQHKLRERLLLLSSCALHVSPELLRRLRLLDPVLRHEPGAEALAWSAHNVGSSQLSRPLRAESAADYRANFSTLPIALQQQVLQCLMQQHATRGRTTLWLEQLLWQTHSHAQAQTPATSADTTEARTVLQRLAHAGAGSDLEDDIARFARDISQRQQHDVRWWAAEGDWATDLLKRAVVERAPLGLTPMQALEIKPQGQEWRCYLAQRGGALYVVPAGEPMPGAQRLSADFSADQVVLELPTGLENLTLRSRAQEILRPMQALRVHTRTQQIDVAEIARPSWAHEFGRDQGGVYALGAPLGANQFKRYAQPTERAAPDNPFFLLGQSEQAMEWPVAQATWRLGIDLAFGHFAELQLGTAVQRFRWIEPGAFLMGSPDDEPEHEEDEGPQHRVQITQGFWLADSACTQVLWLAVMGGKSRSHFKGDATLPVEQVSFNDVGTFIQRLQALLPEHVAAQLPSEAQWEYACRADTQSPFSFGANIHTEQVNFDGTIPYKGPEASGYRARTVPVKSLPANTWGLFEMHGNVFEWCRDGLRTYQTSGQAVRDPQGSSDASDRALRGGAWDLFAGFARSAFRNQSARGYRYDYVGFRFSLRSLSPEGRSSDVVPDAPKARQGGGLRKKFAESSRRPKR